MTQEDDIRQMLDLWDKADGLAVGAWAKNLDSRNVTPDHRICQLAGKLAGVVEMCRERPAKMLPMLLRWAEGDEKWCKAMIEHLRKKGYRIFSSELPRLKAGDAVRVKANGLPQEYRYLAGAMGRIEEACADECCLFRAEGSSKPVRLHRSFFFKEVSNG